MRMHSATQTTDFYLASGRYAEAEETFDLREALEADPAFTSWIPIGDPSKSAALDRAWLAYWREDIEEATRRRESVDSMFATYQPGSVAFDLSIFHARQGNGARATELLRDFFVHAGLEFDESFSVGDYFELLRQAPGLHTRERIRRAKEAERLLPPLFASL